MPRSTKDGPFCWQNKKVLSLVTETFAESNQAASARSVLVALSEVASDEQSETFKVNKALIASKAGVSVKTAERILRGLEELRLVLITRSTAAAGYGAIKSANTYTLIAMRQQVVTTQRHRAVTTMRQEGKHTSKTDKAEEAGRIEEESKKNVGDVAHTPDPQLAIASLEIAKTAATDLEFVSKLQELFPKNRTPHEYSRFLSFCRDKLRTATREGFVDWMLRARPELKRLRKPEATITAAPPPLSPEEQAKQDVECKQRASMLREFRENGLRDVVA